MDEIRDLTEAEQIALLEWYRAAGVDLAVGDAPVDRFAAQAALQKAQAKPNAVQAPPPRPAAAPAATLTEETSPEQSRTLAASANSLEALEAVMNAFDGSPLKQRATQLVFGDGSPEARVMLIGEAPGREEDLQGKPFVGRSGHLLDRMLAAIGLDRTKVYIANTVPWRPPGNRTPSPIEIALCLPFLHRQIALVAPDMLVTLGAPAAQTLLGQPVSITRIRGAWREVMIEDKPLPLLPTFHPAFLLRQPAQKALAWRDMLTLKKALDSNIA
jgi:uracil-DNA glycosylase